MSTSEKTYTFRGSADLVPRARDAFSTLSHLLEGDAGGRELEEAMSAFWLTVLRRAGEFEQPENQSALLRSTIELFIEGAEKLAENSRVLREYEKWAAEDDEGRAVRAGALKAAATRWDE